MVFRQGAEQRRLEVSGTEVTFGLTLAAETGIILTKASAEASFEIKLTLERAPEKRRVVAGTPLRSASWEIRIVLTARP